MMHFCFGTAARNKTVSDASCPVWTIPASQLFSEETGAGFLTEENMLADSPLAIPELNSGFVRSLEYCPAYAIIENEHGCRIESEAADRIPLVFKASVPEEGNYRLTALLYAEKDVEEVFVYIGRRRLAYVGGMKAGERKTVCGLANVCPVIPRYHTEEMCFLSADLTLIGSGVSLCEVQVEKWSGRTVYIAGDSTVTDQTAEYPYYPANSYCGWGQMLSAYTRTCAAVSNHAHSGLTTESFRSEGHHAIMLERIRPNDIVLFQFAHNDQKLMHLKAGEGYRDRMITYIQEIRAREAIPVIVTPVCRNSWNGRTGEYNDFLAPYAEECRKIGQEYGVKVIDLHEESLQWLLSMGCEAAKRYFFPSDYTHSDDYGAFFLAGIIAAGLRDLLADMPGTPLHWDIPEHPAFPVYPKQLSGQPAVKRFAQLDRPDDVLTRVEAFDMVSKTMKFFPTNVYNDMFEDVIGHETYAGVVECAYKNGIIPGEMCAQNRIFPLQPITGPELCEVILNGYRSRKPDDLSGMVSLETIQNLQTVTRRTAADLLEQIKI